MQQLVYFQMRAAVLAVVAGMAAMWSGGCQSEPPLPADDAESMLRADADTAGAFGTAESGAHEMMAFFSADDAAPAAEECCTSVGKMDECWWEDAIRDGVTCSEDADCAYSPKLGACLKDPSNPGGLGVCKCNPVIVSHCYAPDNGRTGVCITDPRDPSDPEYTGESRCGPSYCNGYLKCSCFGGCEWWDQTDTDFSNTPAKLAEDESDTENTLLCCEGNYPWGGVKEGLATKIVTYFGVGSCNPGKTIECVSDAECNDGNVCTSDFCNAASECETAPVANGTACGIDTDSADCYGGNICSDGSCVANPLPEMTSCGAGIDSVAGDCIRGFECDADANCIEAHETAGTVCDLNEGVYDPMCWAGYCGLVTDVTWAPVFSSTVDDGNCWAIMRNAPVNDTCASATRLGTGTVSNTFTGVVDTITGSTDCAVNDYAAGAAGCKESDGATPLGAGAKDLVYYFDYLPTDATQQDLYAFVITVESDLDTSIPDDDFHAVVYTSNDTCNAAAGNKCLYQPDDSGSGDPPPVPWEYRANTAGLDWNRESQLCATGDYAWCERSYATGTWTYPDSPTACVFSGPATGTYDCASTAGNVAQTVVFPRSDQSATAQRVYVFVDGAGASEGTFRLTLERRLWNNGACERVTDAPRVFDITELPATGTAIYQGNLTGYANSDHSSVTTDCGGYDCTATWGGWISAHGGSSADANAFWPGAAYFKIQPDADATYCLQTDQAAIGGAISPVIEVLQLLASGDNARDLCQGDTVQIDAGAGQQGVDFSASAGRTYLVKVSDATPRAATDGPCSGDCNYRLLVSEGICVPVCSATTVYEAESPLVTHGSGVDRTPEWLLNIDGVLGYISFDHNFSSETYLEVRARGNYVNGSWSQMSVRIGGDLIGTVDVASDTLESYFFDFPVRSGTQTVKVNFLNDYDVSGGDRNLYLDYLTLGCSDGSSDVDTDTDTGPTEPCSLATATDLQDLPQASGDSYVRVGSLPGCYKIQDIYPVGWTPPKLFFELFDYDYTDGNDATRDYPSTDLPFVWWNPCVNGGTPVTGSLSASQFWQVNMSPPGDATSACPTIFEIGGSSTAARLKFWFSG